MEEISIGDEKSLPVRYKANELVYSEDDLRFAAECAETFNDTEKQRFFELLYKFREIFSDKPGILSTYVHEIELKHYEPFFIKGYPIAHVYKEEARRQVKKMLDWGVIKKSQTEYVSPLVVVRKKDGSIRVCLDAHHINKRMVSDHVMPPVPNELEFNFSH